MSWEQIITLVVGLGGGVVIPRIFDAIKAAATGKARAERDAVEWERKRADAAWVAEQRARDEATAVRAEAAGIRTQAAADVAAANSSARTDAADRRRVQEWASSLVRLLREAPCVDSASIPPYPVLEWSAQHGGPDDDTIPMHGPKR